MDEDFTALWERHIEASRSEFPKTAGQEPRRHGDEVDRFWDERMDSVVEALEELQSPHSRGSHSPEPIWSTRDDYTETALSSPQEHSFPKGLPDKQPNQQHIQQERQLSPQPLRIQLPPAAPVITISNHDASPPNSSYPAEPGTPMIEIGGRRSKGRELASYYLDRTRQHKKPPTRLDMFAPPSPIPSAGGTSPTTALLTTSTTIPPRAHHAPHPLATPLTPITSYRSIAHPNSPPPTEVHVLILTWAKHDRRGDDGQLLSPGLDLETDAVRACFKRRGYRVQCRVVPEDYSTSAVETMVHHFLRVGEGKEGVLLVVYYSGYGNLDAGGRMVFSSGFGGSSFYWDDVRDPIMSAPGQVLMILDCAAAPGTEQPAMVVEAGMVSSDSTKQLLGVCSPYDAGNFMTKALCRTLDRSPQWLGAGMLSVQGLCSQMKEDLRESGEAEDASRVFVTQMSGGQLLDIYLPLL
ncbi:hypothetical protein B0T18DRAFT_200181 [Schizothecium vesticola]|uniref:Uncharacterized protein n=1 Tax=Schizothecium vesticola TaxID=314040 RepID=A0AA40K363_9PEZI|nr:hypothetical protein B0T18DRAFT_200181 [Schizothecium vesticola]